jgi:hypothetical protein
MKKEFVIRGHTASGGSEVLEFGGKTKENKNYAYRLVEFELFPSESLGTKNCELSATLTASKTLEDPSNPDFSNEGLIGTVLLRNGEAVNYTGFKTAVINDTFLITQNLILAVIDNYPGSPMDVNWQCRFEAVKMSDSEAAVTNYKQFAIFDE